MQVSVFRYCNRKPDNWPILVVSIFRLFCPVNRGLSGFRKNVSSHFVPRHLKTLSINFQNFWLKFGKQHISRRTPQIHLLTKKYTNPPSSTLYLSFSGVLSHAESKYEVKFDGADWESGQKTKLLKKFEFFANFHDFSQFF